MRLHQNHPNTSKWHDPIYRSNREPRAEAWALCSCPCHHWDHLSTFQRPFQGFNSHLIYGRSTFAHQFWFASNLGSRFCDGRCIYVHLLRHFGTPLICFCFTTSLLGQAHQEPILWGMIPRFCWIKQLLANSYMFRAKPLFLFIQYETHSWR